MDQIQLCFSCIWYIPWVQTCGHLAARACNQSAFFPLFSLFSPFWSFILLPSRREAVRCFLSLLPSDVTRETVLAIALFTTDWSASLLFPKPEFSSVLDPQQSSLTIQPLWAADEVSKLPPGKSLHRLTRSRTFHDSRPLPASVWISEFSWWGCFSSSSMCSGYRKLNAPNRSGNSLRLALRDL